MPASILAKKKMRRCQLEKILDEIARPNEFFQLLPMQICKFDLDFFFFLRQLAHFFLKS